MTVYNKLVRDRIPEIMENAGETPVLRVLGEEEYLCALRSKLSEELAEYLEAYDPLELADLMEVVLAIADATVGAEELERLRLAKRQDRGGFEKRLFLVSKQ